ncbi:MAG: hypothetical protein IIA67_11380, partial [Planctomycetes bacterium]|nr:hypothetical protein [Planctomycetota bacterium]
QVVKGKRGLKGRRGIHVRFLAANDEVFPNERIETGPGGAAEIAADGVKAAPLTQGYLSDTIYVYCDVSPNMSPREVVRQFESRYRGAAKANKFQKAASFAAANAVEDESNWFRAARQRLSAARPEDAKGEKLGPKNESPGKDSAPAPSPANEPRLVADDAGLQSEVRLIATMTNNQLQAAVGQLRAQPGWTVVVTETRVGETLAEEDAQRALQRAGESSRLSLDQTQNAPRGFGARSRKPTQAAVVKADQAARFQAPSPSPASAAPRPKRPKAADAAKKGHDTLDRKRSQRFKSSALDRLEAQPLLGKDKKKLKAPAPADESPNGKRDADAESYDRADQDKLKSLDTATTKLAQPAPPRRVVFVFRAAAAPHVEAAAEERAK